MRDFSVHAKPTSKKNKLVFLILISISAMLFVTYGIVDKYRGVIGLVAIGFATAALFIFTKYVIADYYYDICMTETDEPLFVVRQRVGKRSSTLCRISLRNVVKVESLSRAEYSARHTSVGYVKYVYTPTIAPDRMICIKVSSHYEHAEIYIEGTDELAKMLSDYSKALRLENIENNE